MYKVTKIHYSILNNTFGVRWVLRNDVDLRKDVDLRTKYACMSSEIIRKRRCVCYVRGTWGLELGAWKCLAAQLGNSLVHAT